MEKVNKNTLIQDALYAFHNGYACSESVIYAIDKHFSLTMGQDAIAMSSGFPWGLGIGEICGALAGGTMCIGAVFGRRNAGDDNTHCIALTKELAEHFQKECGSCQCGVLIEGYDKNALDRKEHCSGIVKTAVTKVAEILEREMK